MARAEAYLHGPVRRAYFARRIQAEPTSRLAIWARRVAGFAVAVMAYGAHQIPLVPTLGQVLGFFVLCVAGVLMHYSLMFLLASISFWTVRAQGMVWGYYNLFQIARMPDDAFRGLFKALFTFAIPMLLVSNVPVRVLVNMGSWGFPLALLLGMSIVCFLLSEWGWRASLRHYTSASS